MVFGSHRHGFIIMERTSDPRKLKVRVSELNTVVSHTHTQKGQLFNPIIWYAVPNQSTFVSYSLNRGWFIFYSLMSSLQMVSHHEFQALYTLMRPRASSGRQMKQMRFGCRRPYQGATFPDWGRWWTPRVFPGFVAHELQKETKHGRNHFTKVWREIESHALF